MFKKIITIIIIATAIGIAYFGYQNFFKEKEQIFSLAEVMRGDILEQVSSTGTVMPAQKIELAFKTAGKINDVLVEVGDKVTVKQDLARLDASELYIKEQQAVASLELVQAKLNQLLAGESPEQIEVYETAVRNAEKSVQDAEVALKNTQQNLEDVRALGQIDLDQAYEDAISILDDAELKAYNVFNTVDLIQRTYFTANDQESLIVKENKNKIDDGVSQIEFYIESAKNQTPENAKDIALLETNKVLNQISDYLTVVRNITEEPVYRSAVSSTDKTSLDTHRTNILAVFIAILDTQQAISSIKVAGQANINTALAKEDTAQASLNAAQGNLQASRDELALIKAKPRETDIALYQAQIREAKANISLIQKQIQETVLEAPVSGTIISIYSEKGETVKIGGSIIVMISENKFQIDVDIPESDIGKMDLGQLTVITLDAFPRQKFSGKIITIEPAETIIQGVVYYKTVIGFNEIAEKVKSGMTANVIITTDSRQDALMVPQRAIKEKEGMRYIRIPISNTDFQEITVETGIRSSDGMIEIISGLKQGDKVITFIKEK